MPEPVVVSLDVMEPVSIGESTYRQIRADIVFGRLAPDQKLKLDRLKDRYDAGISTLREILSRLVSEGLVVAEGQRGFEVAPVTLAELRELADLRLLIECHAMEESFRLGDMEWEGRVVSARHKLTIMEKRMLAGENDQVELWKRYDWEFHQALVSACGSKLLMQTHAAIYDKYLRYQMVAMVFRGAAAAKEHEDLARCALERDAEGAKAVLRRHIEGCLDFVEATGMLR